MDYNAELQHQNEQLKREIELLRAERKQIKSVRVKLSVLLLVLLLISMVTTTFAWFTISSISSVHNMEITIGTGVQLLISDEDHGTTLSEYTNEVTEVEINKQLSAFNTSLDRMKLNPLTTSNGITLYTEDGIRRNENEDSFLEFDLFFIGTEDMWVHLTSNESEPGADDGTKVSTSSTASQVSSAVSSRPQNSIDRALRSSVLQRRASARRSPSRRPSPVRHSINPVRMPMHPARVSIIMPSSFLLCGG